MSAKIPVGVLGATGAVGQKFIKLLEDHPWFEVTEVAASERTSGKLYGDAVSWKQVTPIPEAVRISGSPSLHSGAEVPHCFFGSGCGGCRLD